MQPIKKRIRTLLTEFTSAYDVLGINSKLIEVAELESEVSTPEIWNNPEEARQKNEDLAHLNNLIQPWQTLKVQIEDLGELVELSDMGLEKEIDDQLTSIEEEFRILKKSLLFTGEYDSGDVILRLTSGVGGLDAQDFTEMLERMYLRWAEKENIKAVVLERQKAEEAGIKTSVIEMKAPYTYGKLKGENGVHRLVRLSPFNADNLRQTSFALVEILPKIDIKKIAIDNKDLKIDVYRSGGHGGQSVNTTDSAVRITHVPTGIVVAIQNERSQIQNKETALSILASKLTQLQQEQHAENLAELRAGKSADWGSQIRNYVLHPYTLVKDTRTKYEERDVRNVLDGDINGFIDSFLDHGMKTSNP
jgi:peptide chain release factor 2